MTTARARRRAAQIALPLVLLGLALHFIADRAQVQGLSPAVPVEAMAAAERFEEPDGDASLATRQDAARRMLAGEHLVGAYAGVSYTHPSTVHVRRPDGSGLYAGPVTWDGEPFRNPIYYGFRVATWAKGLPVGGMIDFTHAKALARLDETVPATIIGAAEAGEAGATAAAPESRRLGELFDKLEFSHGHNHLIFSGLYRLPLGTARLSPYVGLGGGVSVPHVEIRETGRDRRTYGYQIVGGAAQALFGVEVRLAHTSVFIEYKLSYSRNAPELTDDAGGDFATNLFTHHLIGGMALRASRAPE